MFRLVLNGALGFAFLIVVLAATLFGCAGTIDYPQAWATLVVFIIPALLITIDLFRHDRALLERRTGFGPISETRPLQTAIQVCTSLGFLASFAVPALDHRFGWTEVPRALGPVGLLLIVAGFLVVWRVFRANSFAAATVSLAKEQTVISTGPYARVRHPMYQGAGLIFAGVPLALGSWWGFVPAAALMGLLIIRLFDEETFLKKNLSGYARYLETVRWRLVPGLF